MGAAPHSILLMMRIFLCVALCAFVAALPSAEVDPTAVVPESITETPDIALMEASFNDAKATVAAMIQEHGDDSACKDLAQATQDEVISAVAHQQKVLAGMPKGDQCNDEGQGLINEAKDLKATAEKAKADAQAALNVENSKKFNFGDFSFEELTEGECNSFFNSGVYTDAKSKVVAAKAVLAKKVAEAAAAATAVETQNEEASGQLPGPDELWFQSRQHQGMEQGSPHGMCARRQDHQRVPGPSPPSRGRSAIRGGSRGCM